MVDLAYLGCGYSTRRFQTDGAGDYSDQEFCSVKEGAIRFLNLEARAGNGFLFPQVPFRAECLT